MRTTTAATGGREAGTSSPRSPAAPAPALRTTGGAPPRPGSRRQSTPVHLPAVSDHLSRRIRSPACGRRAEAGTPFHPRLPEEPCPLATASIVSGADATDLSCRCRRCPSCGRCRRTAEAPGSALRCSAARGVAEHVGQGDAGRDALADRLRLDEQTLRGG